jgi:predicted permease
MNPIKPSQILGLKIFFGLLSIGMVILVIITSLQSNMFNLPENVVNEPWFRTTLIDFYFNIAIISAWAIYKEGNGMRAVLWILAFIILGSIATCFYVFLQLASWRLGDGFEKVLLRAPENAR